MLYILKIPTKSGVSLQSLCENQNSVQDLDLDYDFTLDFNTRPTFYTQKTPTKFCSNPLTPSKVIGSTARIHVRTYVRTDRQTDGSFFCLFCVLRRTKHEHSSKGEIFFNHAITMLSFFTYCVCDEKVKIEIFMSRCLECGLAKMFDVFVCGWYCIWLESTKCFKIWHFFHNLRFNSYNSKLS